MVKIPTKFEDLLPPAALGKILEVLNQPALSGAVRDALHRVGIKDASPVEQVQEAWQQARDWVGQLANRMVNPVQANPQLINATGELARAEWQGFPMAPSVAEAYGIQAVNFHYTSRLEEAAQHAAIKLLQVDDALLVNSLSTALQLIQGAFKRCAVSRADTVRIPGFGDIGAMLSMGSQNSESHSVHEVGATNGATEEDWSRSVTSAEHAILLVSPNSLSPSDADQQRGAALKVAKATGAVVIELLVDGVTAPNSPESTYQFPVAQERLHSGATAVVLALDGFLGGPAGACIAGNGKLIKALRHSLAASGWSLRGPALAGATAALERAAASGTTLDTGVLDLVRVNIANLRDRAKRLALQIANSEHVVAAEILDRTIPLGPSPWNRYSGPSVAIATTPRKDAASLIATLQNGERGPSILCVATGDRVLIDLRFVLPRDDHQIVKTLNGVKATTEATPTEAPPLT
jgi:seryl-tRNA(Sec) selenium transferase